MSSPDWSRIPFEKMPEWKKQEILARNKQQVQEIESLRENNSNFPSGGRYVGDGYVITRKTENKQSVEFNCPECGKVCKNQLGFNSHLRSHNK